MIRIHEREKKPRMTIKHTYICAIAFLLVLLLPNGQNLQARIMVNGHEPPAFVQEAETICPAVVLSTQCQWKDDHRGRHIYTRVELLIEGTIKGKVPANPLSIEVVGGTVGEITERVSHSPVFREAEQVLLFLEGPSGNFRGKLPVVDGHVFWDGRKVHLDALAASLTAGSVELFAETDEMLFNDSLVITRIVPDIASAGTDTDVTIYGTGFGDSERNGQVEFFYRKGEPRIKASTILSWSDTEIICTVPTGIVNDYAASAGSGPVTVTTRSGTSNEYPFRVIFGYDRQSWWGDHPIISYHINENTDDCTGEVTAVQAAAETWNQTSPGLLFQYAGAHTNTQTSRNGLNEVMWGSTSSNALAVTHIWSKPAPYAPGSSPAADEIIECDMVFNDRANWSTHPSVHEADVQSIALHEFGHFLCLTDIYGDIGDNEYDAAKVMYGYSDGSTLKRHLHPDDIAGIHWIYPPNGPPESPDAIDYPTEDDGHYTIIWDASNAASSYQLERSIDGGEWIQIYSGPHTYFDETVGDGHYRYRVSASNSVGASDWQTGDWDCLVDFLVWEGNGEPNDPFLVGTAEQLDRIGTDSRWWNKHFKLTADIDLSEYDGQNGRPMFHTIALDDDSEHWTGVFDGNDHIITNFTYRSGTSGHAGLFGCIDGPDAQVKRLGLIGPRVEHTDAGTSDRVGSLVGLLQEGSIAACYVQDADVRGKRRVGGLVGENVNGRIANCYADVRVSGTDDVGGLVGYNSGSVIACFSVGTLSGSGWGVGGVAGSNNPQGIISQCYNNGIIVGSERVGGLVGENRKAEIIQCYSTGSVRGDKGYIGGLVGDNLDGTISASFWDIETGDQSTSAGGTGKTTIQMQQAGTYLEEGWDFVNETENGTEDIWRINDGNDYPRLWWENR